MAELKKNVGVFESDVSENQGYRYTTSASYSSVVANKRMTEATLAWISNDVKRVLDAGCGDGTYSHELKCAKPSLEITGFDPAAGAIGIAKKRYPNVEFHLADILRAETFPCGKFDIVIIRGVLHHLSDPQLALRECGKAANSILIIEPNGNNPILKIIEKVSPYHREHEEQSFSSWTLARWCREAGYEVKKLRFIGFVPMFFPTLPAKLIYFFQPILERVPLLCRFLGAQTVILCERKT